jgi:hypothetical protein
LSATHRDRKTDSREGQASFRKARLPGVTGKPAGTGQNSWGDSFRTCAYPVASGITTICARRKAVQGETNADNPSMPGTVGLESATGMRRKSASTKSSLCMALGLVFSPALEAALPVPLRQHGSWPPVAVAGMPVYVPEIAGLLFDAGLADPRGGEYREIELTVHQGRTSSVTTHGWYFSQGFAVCWDGLAHGVIRVGSISPYFYDRQPN